MILEANVYGCIHSVWDEFLNHQYKPDELGRAWRKMKRVFVVRGKNYNSSWLMSYSCNSLWCWAFHHKKQGHMLNVWNAGSENQKDIEIGQEANNISHTSKCTL